MRRCDGRSNSGLCSLAQEETAYMPWQAVMCTADLHLKDQA